MTDARYDSAALIELLREKRIDFELIQHPAVFTCEDAAVHLADVDALGTKNLFLCEEKGPRIFLVSVPDSKRVDLGKLRYVLESSRLTFGSAELLQDCLGVQPGAVTIFGIANDSGNRVELFIDEAVLAAPRIQAHPLRNTASVLLEPAALERFLAGIGRPGQKITVPGK